MDAEVAGIVVCGAVVVAAVVWALRPPEALVRRTLSDLWRSYGSRRPEDARVARRDLRRQAATRGKLEEWIAIAMALCFVAAAVGGMFGIVDGGLAFIFLFVAVVFMVREEQWRRKAKWLAHAFDQPLFEGTPTRPMVLYLRPFRREHKFDYGVLRRMLSGDPSFDDSGPETSQGVGMLVNEWLPAGAQCVALSNLAAARPLAKPIRIVSCDNDTWEERFLELARRAEAIVLDRTSSSGDGLEFETATLRREALLGKTFVVGGRLDRGRGGSVIDARDPNWPIRLRYHLEVALMSLDD